MSYPIDALLPQLLSTLTSNSSVVVQAPPGAGKTTRVPLALLSAPWLGSRKIIMLEPRRVAARAAARFMAASLGERVGETVGYRIRQDSKIGPRTRIEVVTEGILTRKLQDDPALEDYAVVIFDEFHERHLQADLGLAFCLDTQEGLREDLRLIVMSATLDGSAVSELMHKAPVLNSEGRSYPVTIQYQAPIHTFIRDRRGFLNEITQQIIVVLNKEPGSVLVFLPGAGEIRQVLSMLQEANLDQDIILAPLYGLLSPAQQDAAIQPPPAGKRKLVLASALAETSLTIEGIRIVIDSGLMRIPRFDPNTGLTQLVTLPVSQASADQRSGRAGRLEEGICYRMWSHATRLTPHTAAEILDADLTPLLLELSQWGVNDVQKLRWIDLPPPAHIDQARDLLQRLGALDSDGRITAHGKAMAQWGAHPRLAHMMLRAKEIGFGALACKLAAILSERDPLRGDASRECDLQLRIDVIHDAQSRYDIHRGALQQIRDSATQWQRQLRVKPDKLPDDTHLLGVILAYAYPDRIAQRRENSTRYLLSNGRGALLNEDDPLCTQEYIVAAHLDGARESRIYLAAGIHIEDLLKYHADNMTTRSIIEWDDRHACVQARQQQMLGELTIKESPLKHVEPEAMTDALLQGIRLRGLGCLPWDDRSRDLQTRIQFMHEHVDKNWPDVSDQKLMGALEVWLLPYLNNMSRLSHLEKMDMREILLAQLSYDQQRRLDQLAPTHITVPSGSHIRVDYSHFPPVLAVRLQEMFGLMDTPRVVEGRVAVLLHLLSPAQRPVQITQDLAGFWQTSYHDVRKDLKGRYPKHHWPENPLEAQATARAKRKGSNI